MKHPFQPLLEENGVVILDGALATELERRGANLDDPLWSARVLLDRPELIREVHLDYFRAGADVATTASYQASLPGLTACGLTESQAREVIQRSVQLAREARERFVRESANYRPRPLVAGSVGCYGAYLADGSEYRGAYGLGLTELVEFHRPRMAWLVEAGADALACETIPCQLEAEALVHLLAEFPDTPAWMSFSCRDGEHVREGQSIEACARVAEQAPNVVAIGVNCTPPQFVPELLTRLRNVTDRLLVAYPNSGESWDAARGWAGDRSCLDFGAASRAWYDLGARLIGGCCRTTPADIRAIASALKPHREHGR